MPDALTIIAGGVEHIVSHLNGQQEKVQVRQLHIKDFPSLMRAMGDEVGQVAIFCGKESSWAETLTNQSVIETYEKGHQLNDDFFVAWSRRRMAEQEKFIPGITSKLLGPSINGSPNSATDPASASAKQ